MSSQAIFLLFVAVGILSLLVKFVLCYSAAIARAESEGLTGFRKFSTAFFYLNLCDKVV